MMRNTLPRLTWPLRALMIVGFADVVTPDALPRVVSPIFLGDGLYLTPPYDLQAARGVLLGGVELTAQEFEQAVRDQSVTRLPEPLELIPGHALWVGEDGVARYEPEADVLRQLREISNQALLQAWEALLDGRPDEALDHAQRAFCADADCVDALLIKAVVYHRRGDTEVVEYLVKMIMDLAPDSSPGGVVIRLSEALS